MAGEGADLWGEKRYSLTKTITYMVFDKTQICDKLALAGIFVLVLSLFIQ